MNWLQRLLQVGGHEARPRRHEHKPYWTGGDEELLDAADSALYSVIEPQYGVNIVDLGLVYGLTARGKIVEAKIGIAGRCGDFANSVMNMASDALRRAIRSDIAIKVNLDYRGWKPDMMNEKARGQLPGPILRTHFGD